MSPHPQCMCHPSSVRKLKAICMEFPGIQALTRPRCTHMLTLAYILRTPQWHPQKLESWSTSSKMLTCTSFTSLLESCAPSYPFKAHWCKRGTTHDFYPFRDMPDFCMGYTIFISQWTVGVGVSTKGGRPRLQPSLNPLDKLGPFTGWL